MADPNPSERLAEIEARVEAATAGPWRWWGNTRSKIVALVGAYSPIPMVMTFERYGNKSGQPLFQKDHILVEYESLAQYEVLGGRTRAEAKKEPYRHDITGIDHPDAAFIAHAREDIPWLLEREKKLREALREIKPLIDPDQEPSGSDRRARILAMRDRATRAWVIAAEALADSGEASGEAG